MHDATSALSELWKHEVAKLLPEGHAPRFPSYPLLGVEVPFAKEQDSHKARPWKARLVLCQPCPHDDLIAFLEDTDEVLLQGQAVELGKSLPDHVVCYLGEGGKVGLSFARSVWNLSEQEPLILEGSPTLDARRRLWVCGSESRREECWVLDERLLNNISLIAERVARQGRDGDVVASSPVFQASDGESMIRQTLAYLAGVIGGAQVLEVAQHEGESWESLWLRMNILRLLRWEAGLSSSGYACRGAGCFQELGLGSFCD